MNKQTLVVYSVPHGCACVSARLQAMAVVEVLLVHGQKSIPPLKNCKDLTMKLEVKFLVPTSSSGTNFYIFQSRESLKVRKILAYGIRMQKIPQKNPHGDTKLNSGPT